MPHGSEQDEYWMSLEPGQRDVMMADPLVNDWAQAYQARQYIQDRVSPEVFVGIVGKLSDGARNIISTYPEAQNKLAEIS